MYSTHSSVSEGCFLFKNAPHHKQKINKRVPSSFIATTITQSWYKSYKIFLEKLEERIESLQREEIETALNDLVTFVKNSRNDDTDLLPTAILLTGINQSDHYDQFKILSDQIQNESDSDVVIVQSRDCSNLKTGIQKLVSAFIDGFRDGDADETITKSLRRSQYTMQTLKAWHSNKNKTSHLSNLVIILPDFELFNIEVFKKIMVVLSSYSKSLPIVVIIGVATSLSTLQNSLPYRVIYGTRLQVFKVEPSPISFNKIIEKVLLSPFLPLHLSGKVMQSLIDIFLFYDFSINGFVQALKHCVLEHYSKGNIFSLCNTIENTDEIINSLSNSELELIRQLPSCRRFLNKKSKVEIIAYFNNTEYLKNKIGYFLKKNYVFWYNFYAGLHILFIFIKDLPKSLLGKQIRELYIKCVNTDIFRTLEFKESWNLLSVLSKDEFLLKLQTSINFLLSYNELLENSDNYYSAKTFKRYKLILEREMHKIKSAGMVAKVAEAEINLNNITSRHDFREKLVEMSKQKKPVSEFTKSIQDCLSVIQDILEDCLISVSDGPPLIELFVFADVSVVKKYITGGARATVNTALNNPNYYLLCECCKLDSPTSIVDSLPDLSVAFKLHLEMGKMINLFDWLNAFRAIVDGLNQDDHIDQKIQARFTCAVSELEFLGFIKSTKRKTDHVTRLTW